MTDSRTRTFAVIGHPVTHSLSPALHSYFFRRFKINAAYLAFAVEPERLESAVTGAQALGISGLNVTVPYKGRAARMATFRSPEVGLLQVANTLTLRPDGLYAYLTDHIGFEQSLAEMADRLRQRRVVLLGAGGSARAVALALSRWGIDRLTIINRSPAPAEELAQLCRQKLSLIHTAVLAADDPRVDHEIAGAAVLINATPVGMFPMMQESPLRSFDAIGPDHLVYDLIYNPVMTRLLFEAEKRGATVRNGMEMLILQGLAALNLWLQADHRLDRAALQEVKSQLYRELG